MFCEFCSCCCLPLLLGYAYSIHATLGTPFSRNLYLTLCMLQPDPTPALHWNFFS